MFTKLAGTKFTLGRDFVVNDRNVIDLSQSATGSVSVLDYGAKGDGVTDDTAAIREALAAAAGKTLYFPPGTYRIPFSSVDALTPAANTAICGDGANQASLAFVPSSNSYRNLLSPAGDGLTVSGISITCVCPSGGSFAMLNAGRSRVRFENCDLDGAMTNAGASLSHSAYMCSFPLSGTQTDYAFIDCTIRRFKYCVLKTNASTSAQQRLAFMGCDFSGNYNEDAAFNNPNGAMDDVSVVNCRFYDGSGASASLSQLYVSFASVTNYRVLGCSFAGTADEAVHVEEGCIGGIISGNTIEMDNASGHGCIQVLDNDVSGVRKVPQGLVIQGNVIRKAGTAKESGTYGIFLVDDASDAAPAVNVTITGNVVEDFAVGIYTAALLDGGAAISDNVAAGCAIGYKATLGPFVLQRNTSRECDVGVNSASASTIIGHTFANCTTNATATSHSLALIDPSFSFARFNHAGSSTSVYKPVAALGASDRAHGFMEVIERQSSAANNVYLRGEVTWDGTTFTTTTKAELEPGSIALTIVRNSDNLAIQVFSTNAASNVELAARFNGMIVVAA